MTCGTSMFACFIVLLAFLCCFLTFTFQLSFIRSHVCWHVYGLLHRSDHDYNEAIKAYKQALRVDPNNLQILRDLSMLQIQLRDVDGFAVTRNTLLSLKPNAKINWMAFCLARHLSGDLSGAVSVIDIYLSTLTVGSSELERSYESSELALYKNSLLAEQPNNYLAALQHLENCEDIAVDRGSWLMKRAEYQIRLQQFEAAIATIYQLFDRGMTEDHRIHSLYQCALLRLEGDDSIIIDEALQLRGTQTLVTLIVLSEEQRQIIIHRYQNELQSKYPKSSAIQRISISIVDDDSFRRSIDARCRNDLRKGVPSLCAELQSYLWTESSNEKDRWIRTKDPLDVKRHPRYQLYVSMVDAYICSLESCFKFGANDEDAEEEPSTLFWAWYLRAGLHEMAGEYVEGIARVDQCLQHTPTAVDAYELKALLLKASGNIHAAVTCLDSGRDLDRADRYINNQTTLYMLQADMEQEALQRISMFTRHEGNPEQNLYDMQCSWYELELAACLARKGEWGRSLKKYGAYEGE
jgi:N-alpha-acetyltransferase 15/16, NatA auxiliary subunit